VKRLIEERPRSGSPEYVLAALVRSTPALADSPLEAQDRSWARVTLRGGGETGKAWHRRGSRWTWSLVLVGVLGVGAAAARLARPARHTGPVVSESHSVQVLPPVASPPPLDPAAIEPVSALAPKELDAPRAVEPPSSRLRQGPSSGIRARGSNGEDPAPVIDALHALRSERDPARAGTLLAGYLASHPHGVLVEDATALAIEAALARHDPDAAAQWATRYLKRFPRGRYTSFAVHALQP
jgi:hypothetical protein